MKTDKKLTAYQKLKKENADLKRQIYIVCCEPDSLDGIMIKNNYQIQKSLKSFVNAIMQGDSNCEYIKDGVRFQGLLPQIEEEVQKVEADFKNKFLGTKRNLQPNL